MRPPITRRRTLAQLGSALLIAPPALRAQIKDPTGGDPLGSMQWPALLQKHIGQATWRFSDEVWVKGPEFAEDAMNVPILIDARALQRSVGPIDRMVVIADRNPIQHILDFEPLGSWPMLAFRFRMEQGSPVRALVRTRDGRWHVGHTWVNAAGGGCTVPGQTRSDGSWSQTLGQVQAKVFRNVIEGGTRMRLRVMHPMDTGLVAGIPSFHIEHLELQDAQQRLCWRMALHEPVSENPLLTFELGDKVQGPWHLVGRDNGGNRIDAQVRA
ncbi:quinoprotein dehydrogenase-associated SoxYZ-like carrier [Limnohabitans radicicola]|uniref:Quinoprotein dehydrogenase-associated SoxYZ-like carrier n=1 Tax=Limnohabitans radicicola TaxID=2771427 RepID=A0A927IIQ1_9BURK|nr:quinoprotein dehydrogenase-associated SoxYZ-like carrier [Limnohabitans radicicola]MBD8049864.1 quinoprotein dehydrogenase-associated SoxYZ-like carrier [Limnohabitans radicicola]